MRVLACVLLALLLSAPLLCAQTQQAKPAPASSPAAPQPLQNLTIKRLILKDGSYQGIVKYELQGERVRYLSSERFEWEEIPASLIDWPATEKYAREGGGSRPVSAETRAIDAEEQAERKRQDELTPLVAPGLRLPATGGVFLLDVVGGQAQLAELVQNGGEVNRNFKKNVLRAAINPIASQKQTIELKGKHARIQSHVPNPYVYIDVDQDQDQSTGPQAKDVKDQYRIVRVVTDPKKDARVVGNIKIAIYGKVSQEQKFMPTTVEAFSGPWLKVTPAEPLEPGEYALVEMLPDNQMNLFVWDFGVDPKAPANSTAWKPEPAKPNPTGTSESPVLGPRKK